MTGVTLYISDFSRSMADRVSKGQSFGFVDDSACFVHVRVISKKQVLRRIIIYIYELIVHKYENP